MTIEMIVETINGLAAILISLAVSYIPGVSAWYQALSGEYKRLVMLALLALSTAAIIGLACAGLGAEFGLEVACDRAGLILIVRAFIAALVANQTTYLMTPKKPAG